MAISLLIVALVLLKLSAPVFRLSKLSVKEVKLVNETETEKTEKKDNSDSSEKNKENISNPAFRLSQLLWSFSPGFYLSYSNQYISAYHFKITSPPPDFLFAIRY